MKKPFIGLVSLFILLAGLQPQAAQATTAFTLGVLPIHSARTLATRYEPLRAYLEEKLRQPVRLESAPDFARFQQRTLSGDFDLTITPAHFARLAQLEAGYQPLTHFAPDHDALLIYPLSRPLASANDLRGKTLAVIDRLAITVSAAMQYLDAQGLEAGRDYRVLEHRTHVSVAYSLLNGTAAAAVTTSQGLLQMPAEVREKVVVMKHVADIPAFVFLAKPDLPPAQAERMKSLLLAYPGSAVGEQFLRQIGYTAILPVNEQYMARADAYMKATRKALGP